MSGRLERNLAVLARADPALAQAVEARGASTGVVIVPAADGTPNIVVDGAPLHNAYAPLAEADRFADACLATVDTEAPDTIVVLGFGAGHHVAALAARTARRLVVIESNLDVIRAALAHVDLHTVLAQVRLLTELPGAETLANFGRLTLAVLPSALASDRRRFRDIRGALRGRLGRERVRLKILVVSPVGGGSLPLAGYAARGLAACGHSVSLVDLAPFGAGLAHLDVFSGRGRARDALEGGFVDLLAAGVLARVEHEKPDLVLALAQAPLTAAVLERIGGTGVRTALWFVEDFLRFPYWRDVGPYYDYVFTIQRGACLEAFAAAGVRRASYLPCAADPAVHRPLVLAGAEREAWGSLVSFVGAGYRNRRVAFRRLVDLDFKVWGSDWEGAEGLSDTVVQARGRRVSAEEGVRIFNASTINLNLHSSTYVDGVDPQGDFVNPRTFELAACGAFQLVDDRRLLPELLTPGVEVATFASTAELRDRIGYYAVHPTECAEIAAAGRRRVLAEHTYAARMERLLDEVFASDYDHFLAARRCARGSGAVVEAAGADTALGGYLARTCGGVGEVRLEDIAARVRTGCGALSEEEEIFLFLQQYDELFLAGERT